MLRGNPPPPPTSLFLHFSKKNLKISPLPTRLGILSHVHVLWRSHVDSCVKVVITVAQIRCLFRPKNILLVTYRATLHCLHTQSVDFYTHKLLLIKDLFNAVNNLNAHVYAIFRQVKGCNCKMTTSNNLHCIYM